MTYRSFTISAPMSAHSLRKREGFDLCPACIHFHRRPRSFAFYGVASEQALNLRADRQRCGGTSFGVVYPLPAGLYAGSERRSTEELLRSAPVREFSEPEHRMAAMALDYLSQPARTLILSSNPNERREVMRLIRGDLYASGQLSDGRDVETLVERSLGNRRLAKDYNVGDVIRYGKSGSDALQLAPESYSRVVHVNTKSNQITVESADGTHHSYNPFGERQLTAYSKIYTPEMLDLALGDRVQITRTDWNSKLVAGSLGAVQEFGEDGSLTLKGDNGRELNLDADQARHITYGYAIDSPKRLFVERILLSGDASQIAEQREALSRSSDHLQQVTIYTAPDADSLGRGVPQEIPQLNVQSLLKPQALGVPATHDLPAPDVEIEGFGISM